MTRASQELAEATKPLSMSVRQINGYTEILSRGAVLKLKSVFGKKLSFSLEFNKAYRDESSYSGPMAFASITISLLKKPAVRVDSIIGVFDITLSNQGGLQVEGEVEDSDGVSRKYQTSFPSKLPTGVAVAGYIEKALKKGGY